MSIPVAPALRSISGSLSHQCGKGIGALVFGRRAAIGFVVEQPGDLDDLCPVNHFIK